MDNKINLSIFRELLLSDEFEDIRSDLKKFDKCDCYFYYDESNNIRKLWLKEDGFNAPIDSDFVLGGVMHMNRHFSANIDELMNQLRLQKSTKELKFKHVSKSKDFLGCLSEHKVQIFLQWLFHSDLYVHYSNVNNLYYAIVDIIDSIDESAFIPFNFQLKNELYKIAVKNYNKFYELLITYNYPNIATSNISDFYQQLIDFIESVDRISFEAELLRQGLKNARRQNDLVFLQGNPERTVIENYFPFYIRPIGVFSNGQHIFDNEYSIESQFNDYEFFQGEHKVANFSFVDSKDDPLVQVSDCIVGLLGKFYTYVNQIEVSEAYRLMEILTSTQKSTLKLFAQVIKKSEDKSKLLINSSESLEEHEVGAVILHNALNMN